MTMATGVTGEKGEVVMISTPEVPQRGVRSHVILLVFVAVMVTLGVALMGYMAWRPQSPQQVVTAPAQDIKIYNIRSDGKDERVELDVANNKQTVYADDDGKSTVMVLDFGKSVAGIYSEDMEVCLLIGGLDDRMPSPRELETALDNDNGMDNITGEITYQIATDYPVTDRTMLPDELRDTCKELDVFWLTPRPSYIGSRTRRSWLGRIWRRIRDAAIDRICGSEDEDKTYRYCWRWFCVTFTC